jgi:hypothetical protein
MPPSTLPECSDRTLRWLGWRCPEPPAKAQNRSWAALWDGAHVLKTTARLDLCLGRIGVPKRLPECSDGPLRTLGLAEPDRLTSPLKTPAASD